MGVTLSGFLHPAQQLVNQSLSGARVSGGRQHRVKLHRQLGVKLGLVHHIPPKGGRTANLLLQQGLLPRQKHQRPVERFQLWVVHHHLLRKIENDMGRIVKVLFFQEVQQF